MRLAELNAKRAGEEAAGTVRWLRPEFQRQAGQGQQVEMAAESEADAAEGMDEAVPAKVVVAQRPWPTGLTEQIKAVAEVVGSAGCSLDLDGLAAHFSGRGRWRDRLPTLLDTLVVLGRVRVVNGRWVDVGA